MASIGHAVVGDTLYGGAGQLTEQSGTSRRIDEPERIRLNRNFLHAARLELMQPLSGKPLVIEAPLPEELESLLGAVQDSPRRGTCKCKSSKEIRCCTHLQAVVRMKVNMSQQFFLSRTGIRSRIFPLRPSCLPRCFRSPPHLHSNPRTPAPRRRIRPAETTPRTRKMTSRGTPTINIGVNEVNLIFTVTDKHGRYIPDLKQSDFALLDNQRAPAQVTSFHQQINLPLRVGIIIDASTSIHSRFRVRAAIGQRVSPRRAQGQG